MRASLVLLDGSTNPIGCAGSRAKNVLSTPVKEEVRAAICARLKSYEQMRGEECERAQNYNRAADHAKTAMQLEENNSHALELQLNATRTQMLNMFEDKVELCKWMLEKDPAAADVESKLGLAQKELRDFLERSKIIQPDSEWQRHLELELQQPLRSPEPTDVGRVLWVWGFGFGSDPRTPQEVTMTMKYLHFKCGFDKVLRVSCRGDSKLVDRAELLHAYKTHSVIWLDLPGQGGETPSYVMQTWELLKELAKGGPMIYTKNGAKTKKNVCAHVVVTSNERAKAIETAAGDGDNDGFVSVASAAWPDAAPEMLRVTCIQAC